MTTLLTQRLSKNSSNAPTDLTGEEKKDDDYGNTSNISQREYEQLCIMCGLDKFVDTLDLSTWL